MLKYKTHRNTNKPPAVALPFGGSRTMVVAVAAGDIVEISGSSSGSGSGSGAEQLATLRDAQPGDTQLAENNNPTTTSKDQGEEVVVAKEDLPEKPEKTLDKQQVKEGEKQEEEEQEEGEQEAEEQEEEEQEEEEQEKQAKEEENSHQETNNNPNPNNHIQNLQNNNPTMTDPGQGNSDAVPTQATAPAPTPTPAQVQVPTPSQIQTPTQTATITGDAAAAAAAGGGAAIVPTRSAVSQRNVDIKIEKTSNMEAATQQLTKKVLKLDLGGKSMDDYSLKSPKSPIAARLPHQTSLTSSVDVEDRKTLREALYQGIFHRHRRTIFAVGSFLRMLRSRNSQYNTIRSSSEGEDIDEVR